MSKAKKKVQRLTDEQYNAYISTLKESEPDGSVGNAADKEVGDDGISHSNASKLQ